MHLIEELMSWIIFRDPPVLLKKLKYADSIISIPGRQQKEPNYKLIAKETNYQEQKINLLIEPETTAHELP